MVNRLAYLLALPILLAGASSCASSSPTKGASRDGSAKQPVSVTVNGDNRRAPLPTASEVVDLKSVKEAPPIPRGYQLYKGLAFKIESQDGSPIDKVGTWPYFINVKLLDAISEGDFNHLRILHLETDDLSPTHWVWRDTTVLPEPRRLTDPQVSKESYDQALPSYADRAISTVVQRYKCFAVVIRNEDKEPSPQPFTRIEVKTEYPVGHIYEGDTITIVLTVTNVGTRPAAVVSLDFEPDSNATIQSSRATQGTIGMSIQHNGPTVFHLGSLAAGASAQAFITIIVPKDARAPDAARAGTLVKPYTVVSGVSILYKENVDDMDGIRDFFQSVAHIYPR